MYKLKSCKLFFYCKMQKVKKTRKQTLDVLEDEWKKRHQNSKAQIECIVYTMYDVNIPLLIT